MRLYVRNNPTTAGYLLGLFLGTLGLVACVTVQPSKPTVITPRTDRPDSVCVSGALDSHGTLHLLFEVNEPYSISSPGTSDVVPAADAGTIVPPIVDEWTDEVTK